MHFAEEGAARICFRAEIHRLREFKVARFRVVGVSRFGAFFVFGVEGFGSFLGFRLVGLNPKPETLEGV